MTGIERRRSRRERTDAAVELIWKDDSGRRQFECGRVVDTSQTGVAVTSPQALPASVGLIVRASGISLLALSQVRNCVWDRSQYRIGVEYVDKVNDPSHGLHDLLKAGFSADSERLDRLFRSLAFRFHPDNQDSGNAETFLRLREAYRILSVAQSQHQEQEVARPVARLDVPAGLRELSQKRTAILGHLYQRRLSNYQNGSVSTRELQSLTGLESDEVGFILWYLREKGAVTPGDYTSDFAISANGVDLLERAHQPA